MATLAELKAQAQGLNISPEEARAHGPLSNKGTWEKAIRYHHSLQAEAAEENRQAQLDHIYQSPGAAVIVPVAGAVVYFHGLGRAAKRCF